MQNQKQLQEIADQTIAMENAVRQLSEAEISEVKRLINSDKIEYYYSRHKSNMVNNKITAGLYDVEETDQGGMRTDRLFSIYVQENMSEYDLAIILANEFNYYAAWGYLELRSANGNAKVYKIIRD